jgi:hypothetical protein
VLVFFEVAPVLVLLGAHLVLIGWGIAGITKRG